MRLYNTLTRQEEEFAPARGNVVRMYACGLTVYARGHIGNFRTFVAVDLLRRMLRHVARYQVRYVSNFTDVDDRTIIESRNAGMSLHDYTDRYIATFREDADTLGIAPPDESPRATEDANLQAMAEMITALEQRGHAYRGDGSIYFKIASLPDYGKLAQLDHAGIKPGARIDADKYDKENARDFVLWKAARPGEPTWDPGLGPGRPGWHIECSAMALHWLDGPPIDIHCGGVDLIFPHHENEIAQAEAATGQPFARYWFHVEHLLLEREKMSKSAGNVYTIPDVLREGYRPSALRYALLAVHYRKQLRFSWTVLQQAEESLRRLMACLARLDLVTREAASPRFAEELAEKRDRFRRWLLDDLNVPGALGAVFDLVRAVNAAVDAGELGRPDADLVRRTFDEFDDVLGVMALRRREEAALPMAVDEIERLVAERQSARRRRDFATADRVRGELDARGIVVEDTPAGPKWKRK
ncbi:MAG: cysteine--tRNA ligase [Luteitalea sp.]|nr:cysteine--tRNA ligase [Luteitalea sp.]